MSSFRTFAVAGAGNLGAYIAEELLKQKQAGKVTDVVLLSRSSSKNETAEKLAAQGAQIRAVDYASEDSLVAALKGIDVVTSTIPGTNLQSQPLLISAAKKAGVRLFVPSEFGNHTDTVEDGPLLAKRQAHLQLKELGLPYLLTFTGSWPDFIFVPDLTLDLENGKATVGGDGNTPVSFTTLPDIARFLAYVFTTLPPDQLFWKTLRIEGERASFNEVFKQYTAKTGKKIAVTYKSPAELEATYKTNPHDIGSFLHALWAQEGVVGEPEELSNGLYPDWNPKKVIDVLTP